MVAGRLTAGRCALVVVDLQEKLVPIVRDSEAVVRQAAKLVSGFSALQLPIIVTEQNPSRLGPTVEAIAKVLPADVPRPSKLKFSACIEDVRRWLDQQERDTVVLCGIESHVCMMQSVLDLLEIGMMVAVVVDAMSSRRTVDHETALKRMIAAGAIPVTVEMALLELVHEAGTDRFRSILPLIRD
jgi:nicotinamidase-related amidase